MKKGVIITLIAGIIIILMAVTCPGRDAHAAAIRQEINAAMSEALNDSDNDSGLYGLLGGAIVDRVADALISQYLYYSNLLIASTGTANVDGSGNKLLSVGILGHVFTTFSKDDILDELNKALDDDNDDDEQAKGL